MSNQGIARVIGVGLLLFSAIIMASSGTFVVKPGYRGIEVSLGKVSPAFKPEGFGVKAPFVTEIIPISVRQQTAEELAECYSSDLQQIRVDLRLLYRIPETSVVKIFQDYDGDPFESLVAPRVQEALKEVAALQSAEQIVKNREQIIALTRELEHAIEAKMVQEQEASKSKYFQQRVQIEADTAVIKAKGEAESILIRGEALKKNPAFVDLQIVERWDGIAPLVIGGKDQVLLNFQDLERLKGPKTEAPASASRPAVSSPTPATRSTKR
jgi:prohibitin 2